MVLQTALSTFFQEANIPYSHQMVSIYIYFSSICYCVLIVFSVCYDDFRHVETTSHTKINTGWHVFSRGLHLCRLKLATLPFKRI